MPPPNNLTDADRRAICAEYATGTTTQRKLAVRYGVSQPTILKVIAQGPPAVGSPAPPSAPPAPTDRNDLSPIQDLEIRVAELDAVARQALDRNPPSFTAAVAAQRGAAKLRQQLDQLRAAELLAKPPVRSDRPDEVLIDRLVAVIDRLPDEAFERLEDAVKGRRLRAIVAAET